MDVDNDNPHTRQAGPGGLQGVGEEKQQQYEQLRASSSAISINILQWPQQKFESCHRREIDNHNLSLRLEILCFIYN
jgi:hypothetical protein